MDGRAIGVFDSGLGGLTAVKELEGLLPGENIIYFGDSGRMPYGSRPAEEIRAMSAQIADFLCARGVKAVLIACGTISSNALEELRAGFPVPFFGVVDAACREVVRKSAGGRIGVAATEATIRSGAYEKGIAALDGGVRVFSHACPSFAPMVERGHFRPGDPEAEESVRRELSRFREEKIDTLLLGCTHYPLLAELISAYLGGDVALVSAGAAAARELADYLQREELLAPADSWGEQTYYTSGDTLSFAKSAELFLGRPISPKRQVL